ncbi:hypothetical protein R6Q59_018446 [Mikania micrantha]
MDGNQIKGLERQDSFGPLIGEGDGPQVLGQGEPKSVNTPTLIERGLSVCSNKIHSVPFITPGSIPMERFRVRSLPFDQEPPLLLNGDMFFIMIE